MLKILSKAPRLSIRIVILILSSDTLFADDLFCVCFDHPNWETAMLSGDSSHKAKFVKWKKTCHLHNNFQDSEDLVSPWHDIPLYNTEDRTNQTLNMVVEIPRFTQVPIMSTFGKGRKEEEEENKSVKVRPPRRKWIFFFSLDFANFMVNKGKILDPPILSKTYFTSALLLFCKFQFRQIQKDFKMIQRRLSSRSTGRRVWIQ